MGSKPLTPSSVQADADRTAIALREATALMQPIAQWLLRNGVPYGAFADLLKTVFVDAARQELQQGGSKATHSALSVLSGVHRKDVRSLAEPDPADAPSQRSISLASQVFTRWLTDARYRDRSGKPKSLARSGPGVTFESLARDISNDIHPRTVLEALIRLGLVTFEDPMVVPAAQAFVPSRELGEMTALFAANAADHLAAAVHNLGSDTPKFLEQSIFATGLSEGSVESLHQVARKAWTQAFEAMMNEGRQCIAADGDVPDSFRMRFGVYYYSEPTPSQAGLADAEKPAAAATPKAKSVKPASARTPPASRTRKTP